MKKSIVFFGLFLILSSMCWTQAYFTGDGGRGITLAVLEPTGRGLAADEEWMLSLVQSSITGDFNSYSAMTIIDRQNLERIIEEQGQSLSGHFSDDDFISIGRLTNARYVLTGTISRTTNAYMLELAVTDVESGERRASYSPRSVTPESLENLSAVKEASADILRQLNVTLTSAGLDALRRPLAISQVQSQTALARGVVAQRQGTVVEALSFFMQSAGFDPNNAEAGTRLNVLSTNITSGNIGADTRNDILWRRQWMDRLTEIEVFYLKEPMPYYLVYSTTIRQGEVNFQNETVPLILESIAMYPEISWFTNMELVAQTVRTGLMATGRATTWGLAGWPLQSLSNPSPFVHSQIDGIWVEVEILNSNGESLARQSVWLPFGWEIIAEGREVNSARPVGGMREIVFPAVNPFVITDNLSVRINRINDLPAATAATQKGINIMTTSEFARHPSASSLRGIRPGTANNTIAFLSHAVHNSISTRWQITNPFRNVVTVINHGVTSIGESFQNSQLTKIVIPNNVRTIGQGSFANNPITSVSIGANVSTSVWGNTFPFEFDNFYNNNGRLAGTYTRSGNIWSFSP